MRNRECAVPRSHTSPETNIGVISAVTYDEFRRIEPGVHNHTGECTEAIKTHLKIRGLGERRIKGGTRRYSAVQSLYHTHSGSTRSVHAIEAPQEYGCRSSKPCEDDSSIQFELMSIALSTGR